MPKKVQKRFTKVVYKPDSMSTSEYMVIVDPEMYRQWKAGDTTIPLSQVVDTFNVYNSVQGTQGILHQPSKQQLDTVFGTSQEDDVITQILTKGQEQSSEVIDNSGVQLNMGRSGSTAYGTGN